VKSEGVLGLPGKLSASEEEVSSVELLIWLFVFWLAA